MNGYGNLLKKNSIDGRQLITLDDKEKVKKQFGLENEEKIDLILKLVENVKRILKNESFDGKSDEVTDTKSHFEVCLTIPKMEFSNYFKTF